MKLSTYLQQQKLTQEKAAAQIGITQASLNAYVCRRSYPSWRTIKKIRDWSGGEVSFADWDPDVLAAGFNKKEDDRCQT